MSEQSSPYTEDDADCPAEQDSEATPVCLGCLTPFNPLQHYCGDCGTVVGQFTPYIPYLNIPFNYSLFDRLWTRLWLPQWESRWRRVVYFLMLVFFATFNSGVWIIFLGTPLWWWYRRHLPRPGLPAVRL